jgi:nucleoid-associated protein YgaU
VNRKMFVVAMVAAGLAAGCSSKKTTQAPSGGNPAVGLTPPPPALVPDYTPVSTPTPTPAPRAGGTPVVAASHTSAAGTKYVVKKGDTLWGLAQRNYGDGKLYKRIVEANPQIQGDKLLVGQTITIP